MSEDYNAKALKILQGLDPQNAVRKLLVEIHELERTRSEAEANATVKGFGDGVESVLDQLRALSINVTINQPR